MLFYRGAWCPYCDTQLSAFQRALDRLAEVDASVVALSVGDEATARDLTARHGLRFPVGHSADAAAVADATGRSSTPARRSCSRPASCWTPTAGSSSACTPAAPSGGSYRKTSSASSATCAEPSSADRRRPMAPLPHDQDITSWPQLLSAIEDAEAGRGTARLTEICLSVYSALAAAQFQITQLKARVHVLATNRPGPHGDPMTVAGSRLLPRARITKQPGRGHHGSASRRAAGSRHDRERAADQRSAARGGVCGLYQIRQRHAHAQARAANRLAPADHPQAPLAQWLTPPGRSGPCGPSRVPQRINASPGRGTQRCMRHVAAGTFWVVPVNWSPGLPARSMGGVAGCVCRVCVQQAAQGHALGGDHATPYAVLADIPVPKRQREALGAHRARCADGDRRGRLVTGLPDLHVYRKPVFGIKRACRQLACLMTCPHKR